MSATSVVVTPGTSGGSGPRVVVRSLGPSGRGHLGARVMPGLGVGGRTRVALVAEGALLLDGDDIAVEVTVAEGVSVEVVEPAGTVAYDMRGGRARWAVTVAVADGADLLWCGQPLVISSGAEVTRTLDVELGAGASALLRETLVLGRSGERGGRACQRTRITALGRPVLVEDLDVDGASPRVGVLGRHRVVDTLVVLGRRAPEIMLPHGVQRLDLAAEATLLRAIGSQVHESHLDNVWCAILPRGRAGQADPVLAAAPR